MVASINWRRRIGSIPSFGIVLILYETGTVYFVD